MHDRPSQRAETPRQDVANKTKACPKCGLEVDQLATVCPQDGTSLIDPIASDPAFQSKYEFQGVIGSGGMGVIYKARQSVLNKTVAIKMMHAHVLNAEAVRRFQNEGKTAAMLHHPYIVSVQDFDVTAAGQPYMVMDYVEGKTLSELLKANGYLSVDRFIGIFSMVCEALSHAHKQGVLHRDVKPSNIMLVRNLVGEEEVRLMDFGIAKLIGEDSFGAQQLTKTGEALGSPLYMSPEQGRGKKADERSDIYSLGCVMYEALTGTPPFIGATALETMVMHMSDAPQAMSQASLGRQIDPYIESVVMRCLDKDPTKRFQTVAELKDALAAAHDPSITKKQKIATATQSTAAKKTSKTTLIISMCCVLMLICAAVTGYFLTRSQAPKQSNAAGTPAQSSGTDKVNATAPAKNPKADDKVEGDSFSIFGVCSFEGTCKEEVERQVEANGAVYDFQQFPKWLNFYKHPQPRDEDFEALTRATHAKNINFHGVKISDKALSYVSKLPNLGALDLQTTHITALKGLDTPEMRRNLVYLDLSETPLNSEGMRVISHLKSLTRLMLCGTQIEDRDLQYIQALPKLHLLDMSQCNLLSGKAVVNLRKHMGGTLVQFNNDEFAISEVNFAPLAPAQQFEVEKKYAKAIESYEETVRRELAHPATSYYLIESCHMRIAECYRQLKEYPKAIAMYDKVVDECGFDHSTSAIPLSYMHQGECYEAMGNLQKAIECRTRAFDLFTRVRSTEQASIEKDYVANSRMLQKDQMLLRSAK